MFGSGKAEEDLRQEQALQVGGEVFAEQGDGCAEGTVDGSRLLWGWGGLLGGRPLGP